MYIKKDLLNSILYCTTILVIICFGSISYYKAIPQIVIMYLFFFMIPGILFTLLFKDLSFIEQFVSINIFGISFTAFYFLADTIFNIPLIKTVYSITTTTIILILGILVYKRQKFFNKNKKEKIESHL